MGYTVFSTIDDDGEHGSGLSLSEAFARLMAFARCDYAFGRFNGDMYLSLTQADDASDGFEAEPPPALRSKQLDNDKARMEIMRRFINRDLNGYRIVTDDDWQREERKRCERQGSRPVRRIDVD